MENKAFYYSHRFGKKRHLGRSMVEMLGVLAIIGVLSIGGLYAYRQAMIRHRGNELIDFIGKINFAISELCPDKASNCSLFSYTNIEQRNKICSLIYGAPEKKCITFSGGVSWYPYRLNTDADKTYRILINRLPKDMCARFATVIFPYQRSLLVEKGPGSYYPHLIDLQTRQFSDPNSSKDIIAQCNADGYNGIIILLFKGI